jgi:D-inositol-3-phosphate glycosyltransferase
MRIVLVGPAHPFRGGIAQYLAVLYEKLREKGHEVHFVSFRRQFPKVLFPGQTQKDTGPATIDVHPEPRLGPLNPLSWWATARAIRWLRADAVIFKWWIPFFGPSYGCLVRMLRSRHEPRSVAILDNVVPHEGWPMGRFWTRFGLKPFHGYIAQSETVYKEFLERFPEVPPERIRRVHHPVYDCYPSNLTREQARQKLGIKEPHVLLFFGFIKPYKGLVDLLDAFPQIHEAIGGVRLLIVGEVYGERGEYERRIASSPLKEAATWIDHYVPNEEVGVYFRAADVAVLPYRSASQSGIIQIAYAHGLPVVTTRVGGLPEAVAEGESGLMVPPQNPKVLAEACIKFFKESLSEKLKPGVEKAARRFGWEPLIQAIEELASKN